jgi:alpha-1,2-mannosyltransferase
MIGRVHRGHDVMNLVKPRGGAGQRAMNVAALIALVLVLGVLLVQTWAKAHRADGYDFTSYLLSAQALLAGSDPYRTQTPFPYLYPLFLAWLLIPLAVVPYGVAVLIWFAASSAAGLASIHATLGLDGSRDRAPWPGSLAAVALFFLLFLPILQNNQLNGQANLFVLLGCVLFIRDLAAAIALKLLPAVLCVYLLVDRRLRTLLTTVALAVAFCLLPATVTGGRILDYYAEYSRSFLRGTLVPGPDVPGYGAAGLRQAVEETAAGRGTHWPHLLLAAIVLVAVVVIHLRARAVARRDTSVLLPALYLVSALLMAPISEPHHLVLLIPAGVLLTRKAATPRGADWKPFRPALALFWICLYLDGPFGHGPLREIGLLLLFALLAREVLERD